MEKVQDYKTLSREIMACMRPGLVSNCTLGGEELRRRMEAGTLLAHRFAGGLLLLEDAGAYFLLRFYLTDSEALPDIAWKHPVLCETVQRPHQPDAAAAWLKRLGFSPQLRRIRMERQAAAADDAVLSAALDGEELHRLLLACFSEQTGCIPPPEALSAAAADGRILTKTENGKICTLLHAQRQKGFTELRHLAVLPEYRGNGYAMELTRRFTRIFGGEKLRVWVREDKPAARHIYEQNGFTPDGYTAVVWKKEG